MVGMELAFPQRLLSCGSWAGWDLVSPRSARGREEWRAERGSSSLGMQGKGLGVQPRGASCTGGICSVSAAGAKLAVGKLPDGATAQAISEGTRWPRAAACATARAPGEPVGARHPANPCAWQPPGSADVKAGEPNPRGAASQPLCPPLPGLAGSRQAAGGRGEGLQQRGRSTKPPRRYCSRHSHPRHQCGRSPGAAGEERQAWTASPGSPARSGPRGRYPRVLAGQVPAVRMGTGDRESRGDPRRPLHFLARLSGRRLDGRALLRFPRR